MENQREHKVNSLEMKLFEKIASIIMLMLFIKFLFYSSGYFCEVLIPLEA